MRAHKNGSAIVYIYIDIFPFTFSQLQFIVFIVPPAKKLLFRGGERQDEEELQAL